MTKARTLADFISDGSPLADGTISVSEVSGAAPLANPTFTGTVTVPNLTSTGNITLGDTDKAIFGAGSDLQIYHEGNHSFIKDVGTGDLKIQATNFWLQNAAGSKNSIRAVDGAEVNLYYNSALKLASSATGIDVTGDVGADTATITGTVTAGQYDSTEALPTVRPSLLLDFANSKTLDPRITFTRGSTATYWDGKTTAKAEENLLRGGSEEFNNSTYWNSYHSTVTANATTAPDGTTTAEKLAQQSGTTNNAQVYNHAPCISGTPTTYSIYAKAGTRNFLTMREYGYDNNPRYSSFNLSTGAVGTTDSNHTSVIQSVGNGWYRCSLTFTGTRTASNVIFVVTASDADGAETGSDDGGYIYVWGAQVEHKSSVSAYTKITTAPIVKYQPTLQTASSGEARFDHDPVTGESKGLLIEEARTNILTESQNIGLAGGWAYNQFNIYQNYAIAPDGTKTAHLFSPDTTPTTHYIRHNFSSTTGTFSVYAKAGGTNTFMFLIGSSVNEGLKVNLDTGTVISTNGGVTNYGVEYVGNGWYRCWAYAPSASTAAYMYVPDSGGTQTGDGFNGVYLWGAQFEAGSFPTSYIPTSGSTVTRSRDEPNVIDLSWLNNQEGSFSMEGATLPSLSTTGFYTWWSIEGDTSGNENRLIFYNNNRLYYQSAASTYSAVGSVPRDGTFFKTSGSFKYGDSVLAPASFDGVSAEYTGANGPTALQPDILRIGRSRNNLYPVSGHIKKLSFFTKQLNQTTLNAMTEE